MEPISMASFRCSPPRRKGADGRARFHWRIGPDQYNETITVKDLAAAEQRRAMIEETLLDLSLGKRVVPPGTDIVSFVTSGGQAVARPAKQSPTPRAATLGDMVAHYQANVVKDAATRYTEDIHLSHILRLMGRSAR